MQDRWAEELKGKIKGIFQGIELRPLEPEAKGYTTIWLSKKTKAKLNELRQRGATHEDVINFLLQSYNKDKGEIP